jgi:chaperonin cofactor prefoldin
LYYPWYQPGGNGTGHWSNITEWKVVDIPVLGYYSTQNLSILNTQLDWMSAAGIDTILISWWGPNPGYGEDISTNMLFYALNTSHREMRAFVMVEEILFRNAVSQSMIDSFYNYLWTQYITPYGDIYMNLDGKPLVTWWGSLNMTDDLSHRNYIWYSDFAQNTTIRIIGSQDYVNWSCWRPPTYDGQSATPPVGQQDGFVFIEPRYDNTFKTMWNPKGTYGTAKHDQNLTEELYDSQWTTVINRQMTNNDIRIVCIYSWNSFDERSAIEPCTDYTVPDLPHYYLLDKTKLYIDKLMIATTLRNQLDSLNESIADLQNQLTQQNSTLQAFNDEMGTQIGILNSTCNNLQTQLDSMNSTLQVSINRLQDQYNSLDSQVSTILNLQYAFAALIVILIVATIYLGTRKPKTKQGIAKTQTLRP